MKLNPITPTDDKMFKKIYGENPELLKDFIQAVTKDEIKEVQKIVPERYTQGNSMDGKEMYNDLWTETDKRNYIIEMQNENTAGLEKRLEMYVSRNLSEMMKRGEDYAQVKELKVICILREHNPKLTEVVSKTVRVLEPSRKIPMMNMIEYYMVDLGLFSKKEPDSNSALDQHLLFLEFKRKELLEMLATDVDRIEKLMKEWREANQDIETRYYIAQRERYEMEKAAREAAEKKKRQREIEQMQRIKRANEKAEQQREKAEQAKEKAEQEKEKAQQEKEKAQQEKEEAQNALQQERKKARKALQEATQQGMAMGVEIEKQKSKKKMIQNMLANGAKDEFITKVAGISVEELAKLKLA